MIDKLGHLLITRFKDRREPSLGVGQFALPYQNDPKTFLAQFADRSGVARAVTDELVGPEGAVGFRDGRPATTGVVMPETTLHEDGPTPATVCKVRRPGETSDVLPVTDPQSP